MGKAQETPDTGLPPIVHGNDTILILGSFPSRASLTKGEYYGFAGNHFWRLVADLAGAARPVTYPERLALLARCRIALWDVIGSCRREGSLDAAIRDEVPNPIHELLSRNPTIRRVYFNGMKAEATFRKFYRSGDCADISLGRLPSSSPVPRKGAMTYEEKLERWRAAVGDRLSTLPG